MHDSCKRVSPVCEFSTLSKRACFVQSLKVSHVEHFQPATDDLQAISQMESQTECGRPLD